MPAHVHINELMGGPTPTPAAAATAPDHSPDSPQSPDGGAPAASPDVSPDLVINQADLQAVIDMLERGIERHSVNSHQAADLLNGALDLLKGFVP